MKGRLQSDNPAAALPGMLNSGDKVVGVAKFLKLSLRCFTYLTNLSIFLKELITPTVIAWIPTANMNSLSPFFNSWNFLYLFTNLADMRCSIVYEIQE